MARFAFELLQGFALAVAAVAAFAAWSRFPRGADGRRFWLLAAGGSLALAIDEASGLHENLGRWLYVEAGLREPPGVNHLDDLILMGIGSAGLLVTVLYWREVVRVRPAFLAFAAGAALFAVAIVIDAGAESSSGLNWWTEEAFELAGSVLITVAFWCKWRLLPDEPARNEVLALDGEVSGT